MYENMTPEGIKAEILGAMKSDLDRREGSFSDDMAGPVALEIWKAYQSLDGLRPMVWVDETSGQYLDFAAAERGLAPRKAGARAVCEQVELSGTPGLRVEQGKALLTGNGLYFYTETPAVLDEAGRAVVRATAAEIGKKYNVAEGEICRQFKNELSAVKNLTAAQGGSEPETDESLFARIKADREKPRTSGNGYDYEAWALETEGVGAVKIFPLWAGAGTVRAVVADENRQPVDETVVARCAQRIEGLRPIGALVTVESARGVAVAVSAALTLKPGAEPETVKQAFGARLEQYFQEIAFTGAPVLFYRVGSLLIETEGVLDFTLLTVNDRTENLPMGADEVPVMGEVELEC